MRDEPSLLQLFRQPRLWRTVQLAARIGAVTIQHGVEVVSSGSIDVLLAGLATRHMKFCRMFLVVLCYPAKRKLRWA